MITLNGNKQLPIDELQISDKIDAYHLKGLTKTYVSKLHKRKAKTIEIKCTDDYELELTVEHPVFTKRGWVKAEDLKEGDEVLCQ